MKPKREPLLPSPEIRFGPDFLPRLGRLTARFASLRERREGDGSARLSGVGAEFVGYRPYRSGEDLRALDWNLLARLGRPYVRVAAREASERWAVLLDTSASMGVGTPGKLQLAAELATALAALALARRATIELVLSSAAQAGEKSPAAGFVARRRGALGGWMCVLAGVRASGTAGLAALARDAGRRVQAGRVFLIGDFLDCEPRDVLALARPSRELFLARILAREELVPELRPVRWVDAETGAERELVVAGANARDYEQRLAARLELWRGAAARARAAHGVWTSATPFESLVQDLLARGGSARQRRHIPGNMERMHGSG